jgi:hypothetical protein
LQRPHFGHDDFRDKENQAEIAAARSANRGPPYWASTVLRRTAVGDVA